VEDWGVVAVGKHFPGHGDTSEDSHLVLPRVEAPEEVLWRRELVPFLRAMDAGMKALMVAHVVFSAWDERLPASLSPRVVDGLLRGRLGFSGLVLTDDLCMGAIGKGRLREAASAALSAGVDLLIVGEGLEAAVAAVAGIREALACGRLSGERLRQAQERLGRVRKQVAGVRLPGLEVVGRPEHRAVVARIVEGLEH